MSKKDMTATTITPPLYVTQSEEQFDKGIDPQNAKRLTGFLKPYTWRLILSAVLMLIASSASVAGPYFVKIAIDSGLNLRPAMDRHLLPGQPDGLGRAVDHL
jgi:hypothetical protein